MKTSCFTVKNIIESPAFKVLKMALVYLSIVTMWFQKISTLPPQRVGYEGKSKTHEIPVGREGGQLI